MSVLTTTFDRRSERTHLFLVATLSCGSSSNPVRVRNLSPTGALVEGAALPGNGTPIRLRRGSLEVAGQIAWSQAGKAGVSFDGMVMVDDWLPAKSAKAQCRVDAFAFEAKQAVRAVQAPPVGPTSHSLSSDALGAELAAIRAQIDQLGDQLASDRDVLARHPEVQSLDSASQRIGRLIEALGAGGSVRLG